MKDLLKKLSEAHGAPGHEEAIAKIVESELKKVCDEIYPDKLGNLIAKGKRQTSLHADSSHG
jgi:endoglucanase